MKIIEITYSYSRTKQIEAFNPVNIHASAKAEKEEYEDTQTVYNELKKIVISQVNKDIDESVEALRNPQPQERKQRQPNPYKGKLEGPGFNLPN